MTHATHSPYYFTAFDAAKVISDKAGAVVMDADQSALSALVETLTQGLAVTELRLLVQAVALVGAVKALSETDPVLKAALQRIPADPSTVKEA